MFRGKSTAASTPTMSETSTGPFHLMSVSGELQRCTNKASVTRSSAPIRFVPAKGHTLNPRLKAFLDSQVDGNAMFPKDCLSRISVRQDLSPDEQQAWTGTHIVSAVGRYRTRNAATSGTDSSGIVVYQKEADRELINDHVYLHSFEGSITPTKSSSMISRIWKPKAASSTAQTYQVRTDSQLPADSKQNPSNLSLTRGDSTLLKVDESKYPGIKAIWVDHMPHHDILQVVMDQDTTQNSSVDCGHSYNHVSPTFNTESERMDLGKLWELYTDSC